MDTAMLPGDTPSDTQPLFKKRGTKNIRKRPTTPPPAASDSDESGYTSTEDEGRRVKRRKTAIVTASSKAAPRTTTEDIAISKFAADRSAHISETNDATKTSNWFDESTPDSKSLLGTTRPRPTKADNDEASTNSTYKGTANYQTYIQKNPNAPSRTVGPVKAPTNIRTITVTDFAPDVCKDYKQTGFCGFGDSCKFLHAREDYKQGWELDKEWEKVGNNKKKTNQPAKSLAGAEDSEEEDAALEGIPFACIICKKSYSNPIITKCGHYFCEACALGRYRKNPSCAACGAGTGGVFNGAKGLRKILERKRERGRRRKERRREEGEGGSSEEDEEGDEGGGQDEG